MLFINLNAFFLPANTQLSAIGTVLRQQVDTTRSSIFCSENIILYNKCMGAMDRGDQHCAYTSYTNN